MKTLRPEFPEGKRFAFTILDDTDHSTVSNTRPMYALLAELGMRTTKTVWPLRCRDRSSPFEDSQTLEDEPYAAWILSLADSGFEIASHGASCLDNSRETTLRSLKLFRDVLGFKPVIHVNHHHNRDNLYWGRERLDSRLGRLLMRYGSKWGQLRFEGHLPSSPYFWGDIAKETIVYCRNLTFPKQVNLLRVNPTTPYHDPRRPLVPFWFSSCDAGNPARFLDLLAHDKVNQLVRDGGVCIAYTHFGQGFTDARGVLPEVRAILEHIASLDGWFVPVGTLLEWLRNGRSCEELMMPIRERKRMERIWLTRKILTGGTS